MQFQDVERVLVYFGYNFKKRSPSILNRAVKNGYTLITLDSKAISIAIAQNLQFSLIEDWLTADEIIKAKKKSAYLEKIWIEQTSEKLTINEICWVECDREAFYWFWQIVTISEALITKLIAKKVKELKYFEDNNPPYSLSYQPSNIHKAIWRNNKEIKVREYGKNKFISLNSIKKRLFVIFRNKNKSSRQINMQNELSFKQNYSLIDGKLFFLFNYGEYNRISIHIEELKTLYKDKIVIGILFGNQKVASELSKKFGLTVLNISIGLNTNREIKNIFSKRYKMICDDMYDGEITKYFQLLHLHFSYYFNKRWLELNSFADYWKKLFDSYKPRALVVSTLDDAESQIPTYAANSNLIPSFSIPHGVGITRKEIVKAKYIPVGYETTKEVYLRSGISPERLIACKGLMVNSEYKSDDVNELEKVIGELNILVITSSTGHSGLICPAINRRNQIDALKTLSNPPKELKDRIFIKVKVHPGFPDYEIIEPVDNILDILPKDISLENALKVTDLVVMLNYASAPLIQASLAGKPIINFWNDLSIGVADPFIYADIYMQAGELVRDIKFFWEIIGKYLNDNKYADKLRGKSEEFAKTKLDDSKYPSLGDVIDNVLTIKG